MTDLPRRVGAGSCTYRFRLAAAERSLFRGLAAALAFAAAAFAPGLGDPALDRGDALPAAAMVASGIALAGLGALLRRREIQEPVES